MNIPENVLADIRAHAAEQFEIVDARGYRRESCGLVVVSHGKMRYVRCKNIADKNEHFVISSEEYAAAEDSGTVAVVVHSHPGTPPLPSQPDLVGCERSGLPWLIVNWPTGNVYQFQPTGYVAPLEGRQFAHGILDCYSLVQSYYERELEILLPDFERQDEWWLKGENLYLEGFKAAGFDLVEDGDPPRKHDGLLMQVGSPVPNHAAIFLGDGYILHHQMNRLSSRDFYGGWYRKIHTHTVRHRSLK